MSRTATITSDHTHHGMGALPELRVRSGLVESVADKFVFDIELGGSGDAALGVAVAVGVGEPVTASADVTIEDFARGGCCV
jgi:hypothetical protein